MSKHEYSESIVRGNYKVINCISCGYWHVYPIPTEEELNEYYKKIYYENLGNNRSMTDKLNDPDGFYHIQYEDKLRRINKFLPKELPLRVLDIGSGYGDFLRFMKSKGWETRGIEPSESAYEISKEIEDNLGIRCAPFSDLLKMDFPHSSVVTLNTVLEHLREPAEVLMQIREHLLIPGGILNIHVPNDFSFLQQLLNNTVLKGNSTKQTYWLHPPEHLNYWTHQSLRNFLTKLGYKILYMVSTFPLELFPLMGEDYISNPKIGREMHLKRVRFEKWLYETNNHDFKDALYEYFAQLGIGREIEIFATVGKKVSK